MQTIIETQEEYHSSLEVQKKISFYTTSFFVFTVFISFFGLHSVIYSLTKYIILNYLVLVVCFIISFISGMMFLLAFAEVRSLESNIIEYSDRNNIELRMKSVEFSLITSFIISTVLVFIAKLLTLTYFQ